MKLLQGQLSVLEHSESLGLYGHSSTPLDRLRLIGPVSFAGRRPLMKGSCLLYFVRTPTRPFSASTPLDPSNPGLQVDAVQLSPGCVRAPPSAGGGSPLLTLRDDLQALPPIHRGEAALPASPGSFCCA